MGIDKHGSKGGGGYVGGFLQLFDWNAKSRKKLFSSKSELPERPKQGKKSDGNLPMTQLNLIDEDEKGAGSSIKGSSDYSCASSVTDDDGYGSRAPSVVARLMGLDSLPTPNFAEACATPYFDSQSLKDAHYKSKNLDYQRNQQTSHSGNLLNKVEVPTRIASESNPPKMLGRPIEKFQTETLPPKSAKSIPITHHKLLSPIKNPGFIPTKNADHIMEAVARIIEPGPQTTTKSKMPLVGSSSVPLKVRDLKDKVEAAQKVPVGGSSSRPSRVRDLKVKTETTLRQSRLAETSRRPVESNAAKYLKGQSLNKSWDGSEATTFRVFTDTEESTAGLQTKGKSISLAIQAKVNVQKREGLNSSSSRSLVGQKEQSEVRSSQISETLPTIRKSMHKKSPIYSSSGVLRQNNQKQNCVLDRGKLPSKPLGSTSQGGKVLSADSSLGRQKISGKFTRNSKTGSRNMSLESTGGAKEILYSSSKNLPRKKRALDSDFPSEKNHSVDYGLINKYEKPDQFYPFLDRHLNWAEDSIKKGTDVVSFTFSAPMTRSITGSDTSNQMPQKNNGLCTDYRGKKKLLDSDRTKLSSSVGFNVIGSDALSILLEQKLRELTNRVGSSSPDSIKEGSASSSSSILQHLSPNSNAVSTTLRFHEKLLPNDLQTDKLGSRYGSGLSLTDPLVLGIGHKFQGMDEMDEFSSDHLKAKLLLEFQRPIPSPISILEAYSSTESCNSSDSNISNTTEGSKQCSSVQAQEVLGSGSAKKFHSFEADTELSDSASSTSTGTVTKKHSTPFRGMGSVRSTKWELVYVKEILCNVELMLKDFALGRAREIINPRLFDQLENRKGEFDSNGGVSKLQRKVLFDCVGECLDIRCRRYVGGGCKTWTKGMAMVRRKDWLAEEVYKEISVWGRMGDSMVDELVDKDMSSQYGRWVDFEVEAFEVGIEIEGQILNSLVEEVLADIL